MSSRDIDSTSENVLHDWARDEAEHEGEHDAEAESQEELEVERVERGAVRGPVSDRDAWKAPDTKVAWSKDVSGRKGTYTLRVPVTVGAESFYVRLTGASTNALLNDAVAVGTILNDDAPPGKGNGKKR